MTFDNKYLCGTYTIIDLSWYAPYKEFGDNVICMFIYLSFIWHIFKHASSIITGQSTGFSRNVDNVINLQDKNIK